MSAISDVPVYSSIAHALQQHCSHHSLFVAYFTWECSCSYLVLILLVVTVFLFKLHVC